MNNQLLSHLTEEEISEEYNRCISALQTQSYENIDWSRVRALVQSINNNPLNFTFINSIFISTTYCVVEFARRQNNAVSCCPYEYAKNIIYYLGVPPYFDVIRINNLIFKFVLNCEFCMCNNITCSYKPPIPDVNFTKLIQIKL
jgi:hypothetical protein